MTKNFIKIGCFIGVVALSGGTPMIANASFVTYTTQSSFFSAVSGTSTIDFEAPVGPSSPTGLTYLGSSVTIGGVTFAQPEGRLFDFGPQFYPTNGLTSDYLNQNCCASSGINITFSSGVTGVGMNLGIQNTWNNSSLAVTFTLGNGDIINTTAPLLYNTTNAMAYFGFTTSSAITSMNINGPSQGIAIDNFSFTNTVTEVPEPASLALLGLGLLGLGFSRHKKA